MKLICIEGNIGVGKSTLTADLAKEMDATALFEPVAENPYLEKFYADPQRYALEMQFWLMSQRFRMHETAIRHIWTTGQPVIMDRSIYGDWVFAEKNHLDGNIEDVGYASYVAHREVMDKYLMVPHIMVFLEAPSETCYARILKRGRECEKEISLDYLDGLERLHHSLKYEMHKKGSHVLSLDWSSKFREVGAKEVAKYIKTLKLETPRPPESYL